MCQLIQLETHNEEGERKKERFGCKVVRGKLLYWRKDGWQKGSYGTERERTGNKGAGATGKQGS
jgi:hypothetical protein